MCISLRWFYSVRTLIYQRGSKAVDAFRTDMKNTSHCSSHSSLHQVMPPYGALVNWLGGESMVSSYRTSPKQAQAVEVLNNNHFSLPDGWGGGRSVWPCFHSIKGEQAVSLTYCKLNNSGQALSVLVPALAEGDRGRLKSRLPMKIYYMADCSGNAVLQCRIRQADDWGLSSHGEAAHEKRNPRLRCA